LVPDPHSANVPLIKVRSRRPRRWN
jgi:hypothetical protein